ncbi:MAG TPA: glycogen debranching enzyme N-terminal domain-containing protein, partial [Longimicrobiales bacterium]
MDPGGEHDSHGREPELSGERMHKEGAPQPESRDAERLVTREWLVTNGLGGYASGTVSGVITRRYHGLLIAALPAPVGRTVMLNQLSEELRLPDGRLVHLGGEERVGPVLQVHGAEHLRDFHLELGLPVWTYDLHGFVVEKRVLMPHGHNTVHVSYRLLQGDGCLRLKLRPAVHFRPHELPVNTKLEHAYKLVADGDAFEIHGTEQLPPLRMMLYGRRKAFTIEGRRLIEILYRVEASRGYESAGDLWSPGFLRADLATDSPVVLVASVEPWDIVRGLAPDPASEIEASRRERLLTLAPTVDHDATAAQLVLAADQFIIRPAGRAEEIARAQAAGDDARTIIAGYHWFTDWGRDTMISLEGLTLVTGRYREAAAILRTFAHHARDGLIPNMFPDGATQGLYHTADATLWFF